MYLTETLLWLRVRLENVDQAIQSFERLAGSSKVQLGLRKSDARPPLALKEVGVAATGELNTELLQAQKTDAVARFAGDVAKDFNDILTVIVGYADLFLIKLAPSDPNRSYAEEVKVAGIRASNLTSQLLSFSRTQVIPPSVLAEVKSASSRTREDAATAD
jgi:signal transduction histidine kinase